MLEVALFVMLGLGQKSQVVDIPDVKVTSIDVYGVRTVDEDSVWRAIRADVGGPVPKPKPIQRRLESIAGIEGAEVSIIRADGEAAVFVGIRESAPRPKMPTELLTKIDSSSWVERFEGAVELASVSRERDPELLAELSTYAVPVLWEMANWDSRRHARFALETLARVTGEPEKQIQGRLATVIESPETQRRWLELIERRLDAHQRFLDGRKENPLGKRTRTITGSVPQPVL